MLEKKYYKQDLCEDAGRCKLYNPLLTQGQCEYYNKMCELFEELAIYKRALELENEERFKNIDSIWMIEDDNRTKFINSAEELTNYFLDQAKKKLEELDKGESDEND